MPEPIQPRSKKTASERLRELPIKVPVRLAQKAVRLAVRASISPFTTGDHHITRFQLYRRMQDILGDRPKDGQVLAISGSTNLTRILGFEDSQVTEANYPDANILNLPFHEGEFEFVVSNQVLEHVEGNPQTAIDECARVLKPGGIMVHATVFNYRIHGNPKDFWRFTPEALELLVRSAGCNTIIESGGWGNQLVWVLVNCGLLLQPVPLASWHPYHRVATRNDPRWPIVVWIAAEKDRM